VPEGKAVIARDARISSKELLDSFAKGLIDSGINVIELAEISTSPLLYFAQAHLKLDAAIMITGSHNPLDYNGFKLMLNQQPFYGKELKNIEYNTIINGNGQHKIIKLDHEYIASLTHNLNLKNRLNIVWDCNNSGIASILSKLTEKIGGKHLLLHSETDGNFANSQPDPLIKENLHKIQNHVANYDLGIAFDGDGDRLVIITPDGNSLTSDQLIYLLALSLKDQLNKKIIVDIKTSGILVKTLEKEGFKVSFSFGGHSIVKKQIIEEDAILAGEASGHFIINDGHYYPFDDALYIALKLIIYLQNNNIKLLPLAPITKEYRIYFNSNDREKIIKKIFSKKKHLRKSYPDYWWLIRPSNTEDYLLIKYEAMNLAQTKIIHNEITEILGDVSFL